MKHFLDLEYVTRPSISRAFNNKSDEISVLLVRQGLADFKTGLATCLLAKE